MPAPKGLHTYPEKFWTICEAVSVKRQEYVVEDSTRKEALNSRARFYGFRKALQRAQSDPTIPEALRLKAQQTLQWSWDVVPYIDGAGSAVTMRFMHKDDTPMAKFLARAKPGAIVPGASDAALVEAAKELLKEQEPVVLTKTERDYG